jgi:hypothetical protein
MHKKSRTMKRIHGRTARLAAALCTAAACAPADAQIVETSVVKVPQDIVYKGLPGAPEHVTLFGDSSQSGLYVDRIRFLSRTVLRATLPEL